MRAWQLGNTCTSRRCPLSPPRWGSTSRKDGSTWPSTSRSATEGAGVARHGRRIQASRVSCSAHDPHPPARQTLWNARRRARHRPRHPHRPARRPAGPQRRGQEHDDQDAHGHAHADLGHRRGGRLRRRQEPARGQARDRLRAGVGRGLRRADCDGVPRAGGGAALDPARGGQDAHRALPGLLRAGRAGHALEAAGLVLEGHAPEGGAHRGAAAPTSRSTGSTRTPRCSSRR